MDPEPDQRGDTDGVTAGRLRRRLVAALYTEAMLLADEARAYFDASGRAERDGLDPLVRVGFSCESLKVTTRLMHVIAWLLTERAVESGELAPRDACDPTRRLGAAPAFDVDLFSRLPLRAQVLIEASADLHRRTALLDAVHDAAGPGASPARALHARLALAF